MANWSDGYVHDVEYVYGYCSGLNPLSAKFSLLNAGIAPPEFETVCELGFGQGVSINVHAACSNGAWYGNDFNPSQTAFARSLAKASGANLDLTDESFEDFFSRNDLPQFDFIGLHGVWSWVSPKNRQRIIDFIARRLNVGGVVYLSYNTYPGWYSSAPIRYLMAEHVDRVGGGNNTASAITDALKFVNERIGTMPFLSQSLPILNNRLREINHKSPEYLAHEYFNRDWEPMYFSQAADLLESAKLSYATSAEYTDTVPVLNYTAESGKAFEGVNDYRLRELLYDLIVNRNFRQDYWVKGPRRLSPSTRLKAIADMKVCLRTPREDIKLEAGTDTLKVTLSEDVYNPILDMLDGYKHCPIGDIIERCREDKISETRVIQAIGILRSKGDLCFVRPESEVEGFSQQVCNLNTHIVNRACDDSLLPYLVSPYASDVVPLTKVEQLFVKFSNEGIVDPSQAVKKVLQEYSSIGAKLMKGGKVLGDGAESLQHLETIAKIYIDKKLPMLRSLGIVDS